MKKNNLYIVKIRASKRPDKDGTKYRNTYLSGIAASPSPTVAKLNSLNEVKKGYEKDETVDFEVIKCEEVKIDFSI